MWCGLCVGMCTLYRVYIAVCLWCGTCIAGSVGCAFWCGIECSLCVYGMVCGFWCACSVVCGLRCMCSMVCGLCCVSVFVVC